MTVNIIRQTIIMLILIITGIICSKTGVISEKANKDLSRFMLQVVNPVLIFMSYQTDMYKELVHNLLTAFGLSLLTFAVMIPAAYLLIPKKADRDTEIERFSAIYSNCGFMGIPLVNAMFGMEGVFYLTAFITVFNLVVWTHGVILMTGERDFKQVVKVFYSPTILSIVLGMITFFLQIRLPEIPSAALNYIKELNTPMAMIVSGVTMAGTDVKKMIRKAGVYRTCAMKLLIIPMIVTAVITLIGADPTVSTTIIVAAAAPPATMCTLFSLRYGKNSLYASEIFTAGTILSVFSLPIITIINEYLSKMRN